MPSVLVSFFFLSFVPLTQYYNWFMSDCMLDDGVDPRLNLKKKLLITLILTHTKNETINHDNGVLFQPIKWHHNNNTLRSSSVYYKFLTKRESDWIKKRQQEKYINDKIDCKLHESAQKIWWVAQHIKSNGVV